MPKVTVCGVPKVKIGPPRNYTGSTHAVISKAQATQLTTKVFGAKRLPRMGHEMLVCGDTWLDNTSGRFTIVARKNDQLRGTRKRKRRK